MTASVTTEAANGAPARADGPIAELADIDFSYGQLQVLFGVSLHVGRGEALALLGTNGAGKSTLLRVLCGLVQPSGGTVRFDGEDMRGVAPERRPARGLVLVPGGNAVFRDMTVAENLEMKARPVRHRRAWVRERRALVLDIFPHLAERMRVAAGSLSGGEQQQLALAGALLLEPQLLCIDELSLGLAPLVVQELLGVVRQITSTGVALLLVEQSLNIAASVCDRAVFLEKGEVRFEGRTVDLLERDDVARAVFLGGA